MTGGREPFSESEPSRRERARAGFNRSLTVIGAFVAAYGGAVAGGGGSMLVFGGLVAAIVLILSVGNLYWNQLYTRFRKWRAGS